MLLTQQLSMLLTQPLSMLLTQPLKPATAEEPCSLSVRLLSY
jgi:hypothetical protein